MRVTGGWRLTFGWRNSDAADLDLDDFHRGSPMNAVTERAPTLPGTLLREAILPAMGLSIAEPASIAPVTAQPNAPGRREKARLALASEVLSPTQRRWLWQVLPIAARLAVRCDVIWGVAGSFALRAGGPVASATGRQAA